MSWNTAETPFGPIAYRVNSDGELYVQPWRGPLFEYTDPTTGTTGQSIVGNKHEHDNHANLLDVLTINGRSYTHGFRVRWSPETPYRPAGAVTAAGLDDFTDAAHRKLSEWFTEHWAELATPVRIAAAAYDQALYVLKRSAEELEKVRALHIAHTADAHTAAHALMVARREAEKETGK